MKKLIVMFSLVAFGLLPAASMAALPASGTLIKASGPAVYWYSQDGKRYVFPNENTYKTWFADFSTVVTVTDAELASLAIGGNVTYRPGVKMVKIQSDSRVYAVDKGGTLRWVKSEAVATALYGAAWASHVDDLSDAFFVNYSTGADVDSSSGFSPAAATAAAVTIDIDKTPSPPPPEPQPEPQPEPEPPTTNPAIPDVTGTVEASLVVAGQPSVVLARYALTAQHEELKLVKVRISLQTAANAQNIKSMSLYDGHVLVGGPVVMTAGNADFTGVDFVIPRNGSNTLTVAADLNTVPEGARPGDDIGVLMHVPASDDGTYELRGTTTSTVIRNSAEGDKAGNQKIVVKTQLVVSNAALPSTVLGEGDRVLSKFNVAADAAEQVSLKKLTFNVSKSNVVGVSGPVVRESGGTNIAATASASASCAASAGTACTLTIVFTNEQIIAGGTQKTYELHAAITGSADGTSTTTFIETDAVVDKGQLTSGGAEIDSTARNFIWSDNSGIPHVDSDGGSGDWFSGRYVLLLPNDSQTLSK